MPANNLPPADNLPISRRSQAASGKRPGIRPWLMERLRSQPGVPLRIEHVMAEHPEWTVIQIRNSFAGIRHDHRDTFPVTASRDGRSWTYNPPESTNAVAIVDTPSPLPQHPLPSVAYLMRDNGYMARRFEELATTRSGLVLVQDEEGRPYALVPWSMP